MFGTQTALRYLQLERPLKLSRKKGTEGSFVCGSWSQHDNRSGPCFDQRQILWLSVRSHAVSDACQPGLTLPTDNDIRSTLFISSETAMLSPKSWL